MVDASRALAIAVRLFGLAVATPTLSRERGSSGSMRIMKSIGTPGATYVRITHQTHRPQQIFHLNGRYQTRETISTTPQSTAAAPAIPERITNVISAASRGTVDIDLHLIDL